MKIEIEQKETEVINWSKSQLVISNRGEIVITNGEHKRDAFEGYNLNQKQFSLYWGKSYFKKFNGKITLSNE